MALITHGSKQAKVARNNTMKINLLELFSGICGFSMGLEQAGFVINKHYLSEVDKYANSVSRFNYPDSIQLGDIQNVTGNDFQEPINIITFGSPCQDLSIAGKRKGLAGARSGLFTEAVRIIKEVQPDLFIWENVKGAYSSNRGRDFQKVLQEIADIGLYECEWQLCNTRWVLPQNRERIYLVGHLRGSGFRKVFPFGESSIKDGAKINIAGDTNIGGERGSIYNSDGIIGCLSSTDYKQPKQILTQVGTIGKDSRTNRVYDPSGLSSTLVANGGGAKTGLYEADKRIRRLTPLECERLQGFPDNFTAIGIDDKGKEVKISDTQRYKMCGNAVTTKIVELIGRKLLK